MIPRFVVVAFPVTLDPTVRFERLAFVPKMFVAKKLVVVAEEPVAFTKVKFWRVDDAVEVKPTSVGLVLKTSDPDPVSSVIRAASFAEVSSDVEEILLLKSAQSEALTHPFVEAEAVSQVMEFTERVSPPENERMFSKSVPAIAATTDPFELVLRRDEVMVEIARAEVVALLNVAVPAVRLPAVALVANELVDDAVVANEFVDVELPIISFVAFKVPTVAFVAERFVAKLFVEVLLVEVLLMVVSAVMVLDAETITPTVVVGARYPFTRFQSFPKSDEVAA